MDLGGNRDRGGVIGFDRLELCHGVASRFGIGRRRPHGSAVVEACRRDPAADLLVATATGWNATEASSESFPHPLGSQSEHGDS